MKKLILFTSCLIFSLTACSQSLTFKEIMHLAQQKDIRSFLSSKSFELTSQDKGMDIYELNQGTDKAERVFFSKAGTSYETMDSKYMALLVGQMKKQFPLIIKSDEAKEIFYQFGNTHMIILVNVEKNSGTFSGVGISRK